METQVRVTIQTSDDKAVTYIASVEVDEDDLEASRKTRRVVGCGVEMAFALLDAQFMFTES